MVSGLFCKYLPDMKRIMIYIVSALVLFSCSNDVEKWTPTGGGGTVTPPGPSEDVVWHERAKETFDLINQYYRISSGTWAGLYNENYPKGSENSSYLWPYDGLVSGVALLHRLGYGDIDYPAMIDQFERYWYEKDGVGGYGSQTNGTSGQADRFYDDNSIVGLDLVEAYNLTGDTEYVERAGRIVDFLAAGEDDIFGGALWWNESAKNQPGNDNSNKPACANGYATSFLLHYYQVCPQEEKSDVLAFAKRLYDWLVDNLRDPADGCYWNDKGADGNINNTKWTYNTGVMISNGIDLFRITGEQEYLDQAKESAMGSYSYFVKLDPLAGMLVYPGNDPWFTIKLINAYIDIEPYYSQASSYINTFINFADNAWENARQDNGLFFENWTGTANPDRDKQLLMQDAALESFGVIALYKGEKVERQ